MSSKRKLRRFAVYSAAEEEEERRLGVSTKLKLYTGPFDLEKVLTKSDVTGLSRFMKLDVHSMSLKRKLSRFAAYSAKDEAEEKRLGVSTKLKLYSDPFDIKKELTNSDVNGLSRLMLPSETVQDCVLNTWSEERVAQAKTLEGIRVTVVDVDTFTEHQLTFKRWTSSNSFVLMSNWRASFVGRRKLKAKDEIGLLWSPSCSKFYFRVLSQQDSVES